MKPSGQPMDNLVPTDSTGGSLDVSHRPATGSTRGVLAKLSRDGGISPSTVRKARAYIGGLVRGRVRLSRIGGRGRGVRVNGGLVLQNDGSMSIGPGTVLRGVPIAVELVTGPDGVLEVGVDCLVNSGSSIAAYGLISIGDRVLIGPQVIINDSGFHDLYDRAARPAPRAIVIERDVWIGARASILPGVRIGEGAVVGAHALVNSDVEPYSVVGGVPARLLRKLDPERLVRPGER